MAPCPFDEMADRRVTCPVRFGGRAGPSRIGKGPHGGDLGHADPLASGPVILVRVGPQLLRTRPCIQVEDAGGSLVIGEPLQSSLPFHGSTGVHSFA
jgi:hypothetical protein